MSDVPDLETLKQEEEMRRGGVGKGQRSVWRGL